MRLPKSRLLALVAVSAATLGGSAGIAQAHSANGNGGGGTHTNSGAYAIPLGEFNGCEVSLVFNKNHPSGILEFEGTCF